MEMLMPEIVDSGKLKEVQLAMKKDLRVAAKKLKGKPVFFVVASDVPLADKQKLSLFVAVRLEAEAKAWHLKLKGKKPTGLVMGTCKLETKDGKNVAVALDKVKGDRKAALRIAQKALKLAADPNVKFSDPELDDSDEAPDKASAAAPPAVDPKAVAAAAKTSATMLSNFGTSTKDLAGELGLSVDELNLIIANNAAALKAAVDEQIDELKAAAK